VRTWYRRDTGWYGHARRSRQARVRAPGLQADVTIEDAAIGRALVDSAYRDKYGYGAAVDRMVGDEAAATTLRLKLVLRP